MMKVWCIMHYMYMMSHAADPVVQNLINRISEDCIHNLYKGQLEILH